MPAVFLTGPLAWPPLLAVVGAEPSPAEAPEAVLSDAAVATREDVCFPPLVPAAGARTRGRLVAAGAAGLYHRLTFFAAVLGLAPVPRHVRTDAGPGTALTFMAEDDGAAPEPWRQELWSARWGPIACAAAEEIMECYGCLSPETLAARLPMILSRASTRVAAAAAPEPARLRSDRDAATVERIGNRILHAGFFLTRVHELRLPCFSGGISPPLHREVFVATDAALVLPYDPARDRVLLVEQFRMGPFGRGDPRPWVLEPVAGRIDAGEAPQETARREAAEEAGLSLGALEHISSHYCSPGYSTEFFHCFLGLADLPETAPGRGGLASEHEDIRTHVLTFDAAMALVASGEINIGPLVLMLLWLQRERPRLRAAP